MKIHLYFTLFVLFTAKLALSQSTSSDDALNNSQYIFEGTVVDLDFIKDETDNYFVSYILKVETLLKSADNIAVGDSVELISPLPDDWVITENGELIKTITFHQKLSALNGLRLDRAVRGVFMANSSENIINSTKLSLVPYCLKSNCFYRITSKGELDEENHKVHQRYSVEGFDNYFESREKFNEYLKQFQLAEIETEHKSDKKKDVEFSERTRQNKIQYEKRVETARLYQEYLDNRRINSPSQSQEKQIETITYEILNEVVTGTGTQFYEFDIYVNGNTSNTYFDNSAFVIEFNTFAFGVDLSLNNLVTITSGANFSSSTYVDPMSSLTDDAPDAIRFGIGSDFNGTSWNRTLLTPTPQHLLHVKMELNSCIGYTDITFIDIPNVSIVALYTETPDIDPISAPYLAYQNPNYIQPFPYELCPAPVINSFSPMTISSGTKSVLTINGVGFGNTRGNGQVQFPEANDGGNSIIEYLNHMDYISWSDTEIKIVLPFLVDTLATLYFPGSGFFRVKRDDNMVAISPFTIDINFAHINNSVGSPGDAIYRKSPYKHVDQTVFLDGFAREFSLDTSITNNPAMAAIVRKALRDWSCATTINWTIIDTVTQQGLVEDGKSIIYLDDSFNGSPLASTSSKGFTICNDASTNEEFIFWDETDIGLSRSFISPNTDWFFDTTMTQDIPTDLYDFYSTIVHELGHAHYLGHVNDLDEIIYYAEPPGFTTASSRYHLYSSPKTIDGGTYVTSSSESLNTANCNSVSQITPLYLNFCGDLSVPNSINEISSIVVYPNPFQDEIKLKLSINNTDISYAVTDMYGKLITEKALENINSKDHIETIELPSLSAGIYFVTISIGNEAKTVKIIKQ